MSPNKVINPIRCRISETFIYACPSLRSLSLGCELSPYPGKAHSCARGGFSSRKRRPGRFCSSLNHPGRLPLADGRAGSSNRKTPFFGCFLANPSPTDKPSVTQTLPMGSNPHNNACRNGSQALSRPISQGSATQSTEETATSKQGYGDSSARFALLCPAVCCRKITAIFFLDSSPFCR